jgi:hypothetical protein
MDTKSVEFDSIRARKIAQKSCHFRRRIGTDPRLSFFAISLKFFGISRNFPKKARGEPDTKMDTKRVKFGSKR